jgi:hypothetical protein
VNLAELRSQVLVRGGWPDNDALYTTPVLTQLVNQALHHIETEHDWAWLEVTEVASVGTGGSYTPPAAWQRTVSVHHAATGYPLKRSAVHDLDLFFDAVGVPKLWANYGGNLVVAPKPATATNFNHRYLRAEPDLTADSHTPLTPARWHHAVVEYAVYLAYRREGNLQEAGAALAGYEAWLEQMRKVASRYSPSLGGGESPAPAAAEDAKR